MQNQMHLMDRDMRDMHSRMATFTGSAVANGRESPTADLQQSSQATFGDPSLLSRVRAMDGLPLTGSGGQATPRSMLPGGPTASAHGYTMNILEEPMSMFVGARTVAPSVAATTRAAMTLPMSVLSQHGPETVFLPSPLAPTATMVAPVVVAPASSQFGLAFSGSPANMLMAKNAIPPKFTSRHSDWVSFRRDWELYVQMLGGRREITDTILLCTLGQVTG